MTSAAMRCLGDHHLTLQIMTEGGPRAGPPERQLRQLNDDGRWLANARYTGMTKRVRT
jgi:hypothetical protein